MPMHRKKTVLLTLTGGGFRWESCALLRSLGPRYDYHFATNGDSRGRPPDGLPQGPLHIVEKVTSMRYKSPLRIAHNFLRALRDSYSLIKRIKPDVIICVGSSIAVPLFVCGKLMGKTTVYIESITRVERPSRTGRILSTLRLCDRHYVQWPEAAALYPRARYAGTVL
ncbi:hypothetical protein [Ectothiorhodospira variabilis]|uniref:hypothetical protein n=1 Tax=Ectothiorhodospira variabilis TaxID=505694 RepID=UPI003B75BE81